MEHTRNSPKYHGVSFCLLLGTAFLLGGVLGSLFSSFLSGDSVAELEQYLNEYMRLQTEGAIRWSFPSVLWSQGRWMLCCILLGLSGIGVVGLPALFGIRGFLTAFGAGCFVRVFGGVGALPATLLFGIPAILWAPGFFLTGTLSLSNSLQRLRRRMGEVSAALIGPSALRCCVLLDIGLLVVCGCFECGLLPRLFRMAARILG